MRSSIQPSSPSQSKGDADLTDMESRAKDMATRCWQEDDEFLSKDKIAEWLGGTFVVHLSRWFHIDLLTVVALTSLLCETMSTFLIFQILGSMLLSGTISYALWRNLISL